jgi:hypothetical protein
LNDIQSLQKLEQEMFSNIEENPNLTPEQQEQIVQKINQISQMRVSLYKTLGSLNKSYEQLLSNSTENLKEQTRTIQIVEKELNGSKKRLDAIEQEKNNQFRMIEINEYYSQQYSNHTKVFKIVLVVLILLILIIWLRNNAYLPDWVFSILFFLIIVVGLWNLLPVLYYMWLRDNMNYQEYYWRFDVSNAPKPNTNTNANTKDPWVTSKSNPTSSMCKGQECCDDFSTYDISLNICVPNNMTTNNMTTNNMTTNNMTTNTKTMTNSKNDTNTDSYSLYDRISNDFSTGFSKTSNRITQGISGISSSISKMNDYPESFQNLSSETCSDPIMDALARPELENRYKKPDATINWSPQPTTSSGQHFVQFNGF